MTHLTLVLLVVLLSACSTGKPHRILAEYIESESEVATTEEESTEASAELSLETLEKRKQVADLAKKNHGLMHIHRYGPGFDVLLTLDAGDSDVSFSMKLPQSPDADEGSLQKSAEEIAEQNLMSVES
jgi:hypothetical protein